MLKNTLGMSHMNALHERIETVRNLIFKLKEGKLTQEELEALVTNTRELYERSVVLQYKAFEEKVFGTIERPEPTEREELVETLRADAPEVAPEPTPEPEIIKEEQPAFDFSLFEEPIAEPELEVDEPVVEEHISVSHSVNEEGPVTSETVTIEETSLSVDHEALSTIMTYLNRELDKHTAGHLMPKLESLVGSFGLNERLQFINELFNGSSEDFAMAVSELDGVVSYTDALAVFAQMSLNRGWSADSETVLDFLTKVKRRYA
jgi:hypothetical protein